MSQQPFLSVVCPTFNEAAHIESLLAFFVAAEPTEKELWVIDGGSTDQTCALVTDWAAQHPNIHLLHNPNQTVPYALNLGIQAAQGDPIVRLDAHTRYAPDYFEAILRTFAQTGADIVGGPMRAVGQGPVQEAIALSTSCVFGIGNSHFHQETYEGWTDTVYLGAWKRAIFDQIGGFDARFTRNQDDEFHYRAKQSGLKIYLHPAIRSYYHPRETWAQLWRQYFEYGFYKPLVFKKLRHSIRLRHIIPSVFVLYVCTLPLSIIWPNWGLPALGYILLSAYFSLKARASGHVKWAMMAVFPVLHVAYGIGFLRGIWQWNFSKNEQ